MSWQRTESPPDSLVFALIALVLAVAGGRVMESQLYDVAVTDPATYAVVAFVFASVGALACLVPAMRAMRVDPLTALRGE